MIKIIFICLAFSNINGLRDKCKYHEFDCDNPLKCIPFSSHCNGVVDCEVKSEQVLMTFVTPSFSL